MNIHWFPGHMTKALRMMQDNIKAVDCIGYVLDARAPYSCLNPSFTKLLNNLPCLFILNKCDLADDNKLNDWKQYFGNMGKTILVSGTNNKFKNEITSAFKSLSLPLVQKFRDKGVYRPIRAMIVGVPNSGKSTIINCLSPAKTAITGDKPGVTKGKQWVRLDNGLELLDTPGTLWSKFEDDRVAAHLCYIGSIKDDIVDIIEVAQTLVDELTQLYPDSLMARYKLSELTSGADNILRDICISRSLIMAGGVPDIERGAKVIIDDFRKGKLGKITLESVGCVNG